MGNYRGYFIANWSKTVTKIVFVESVSVLFAFVFFELFEEFIFIFDFKIMRIIKAVDSVLSMLTERKTIWPCMGHDVASVSGFFATEERLRRNGFFAIRTPRRRRRCTLTSMPGNRLKMRVSYSRMNDRGSNTAEEGIKTTICNHLPTYPRDADFNSSLDSRFVWKLLVTN